MCVWGGDLVLCELEFASMDPQKSEMTETLAYMSLFLDKVLTFSPMYESLTIFRTAIFEYLHTTGIGTNEALN